MSLCQPSRLPKDLSNLFRSSRADPSSRYFCGCLLTENPLRRAEYFGIPARLPDCVCQLSDTAHRPHATATAAGSGAGAGPRASHHVARQVTTFCGKVKAPPYCALLKGKGATKVASEGTIHTTHRELFRGSLILEGTVFHMLPYHPSD